MSETVNITSAMSSNESDAQGGVRIAVEGCGHGVLHAIYASVNEACRVKGWDGVDLLIIGGDFQAVRNQHDLNVTSMPPKYRRMADFHEYYSGARTAPYLTIFIGGNHEASNHLFELYYGGWVAPNIYYLGAANVIQFGPLRIAGLTGIWKGYDYRKPHFERLPYNREETGSIYHVRELDVRKLLSLSTQVDIGLSHDWPNGIEMHGDYGWLFRNKRGFENDSRTGKLGSVAARQCLDRLRPLYWFSAHLHTKFSAILHHDKADEPAVSKPTLPLNISESSDEQGKSGANEERANVPSMASSTNTPKAEDRVPTSAWQLFGATVQQEDAKERERILRERENERREEERVGTKFSPKIDYQETFKKVETRDGFDRTVVETTHAQASSTGSANSAPTPNLDGAFFSRPTKRQRLGNPGDNVGRQKDTSAEHTVPETSMDGNSASVGTGSQVAVNNPDAIDIDMSDDDDATVIAAENLATPQAKPLSVHGATPSTVPVVGNTEEDVSTSMSGQSEDGGVKLKPQASSFTPMSGTSSPIGPKQGSLGSPASSRNSLTLESNPRAKVFQPETSPATGNDLERSATQSTTTVDPENEVSEEMRAQLAALSSNFTQTEKTEISPPLPFPEAITNKTTHFLALGKCEPFQEFLQLLTVNSITSPARQVKRPLKLSYDPEWLAILRVFAPELSLGGNPTDKVAPHRGDTWYREQIIKEQEWIKERVVKPGQLQVPENFSITAPVYDPELKVGPNEMPREMTNPQTKKMSGILECGKGRGRRVQGPYNIIKTSLEEKEVVVIMDSTAAGDVVVVAVMVVGGEEAEVDEEVIGGEDVGIGDT
ncbi:uncharacterized protein Z518_10858 [Rhinocladiella mackenziei CBS 650.93]|uniref:Lariat debranching enzyme C-terminal domain-containing protein n=1 Tax=Rhinocladiella mackenziei CBS 650.93 TaxID=1442369 RepID=A0A0D2I9J3_9EURO|nr:uncharacterized protein Z518_10858 [Rhinocladiella mackenziei CBS 650.93]KIW99930.1 hypothetical protein Z518_10858 [Rhinocladiella mackenziei CBS 650.93]